MSGVEFVGNLVVGDGGSPDVGDLEPPECRLKDPFQPSEVAQRHLMALLDDIVDFCKMTGIDVILP